MRRSCLRRRTAHCGSHRGLRQDSWDTQNRKFLRRSGWDLHINRLVLSRNYMHEERRLPGPLHQLTLLPNQLIQIVEGWTIQFKEKLTVKLNVSKHQLLSTLCVAIACGTAMLTAGATAASAKILGKAPKDVACNGSICNSTTLICECGCKYDGNLPGRCTN